MKRFQHSFLAGAVKIIIIGNNPDYFLEMCSKQGIRLWDVTRHTQDSCTATVSLSNVSLIRKIRFRTNYKIIFKEKYGLPFYKKRLFNHYALLVGLFIGIGLFILLSNMVWKVNVTGVPEALESKIHTHLEKYGLYQGAFKWSIAEPNDIQQLLMEDLPELLWVGVHVKGTTYQLEAVEKRIVKRVEEGAPQHLIATKNGVIRNIFVEKGSPNVNVNDFVEKGQLLVSGEIEKRSFDEDAKKQYEYVHAQGEVRAITWYNVDTVIPLETRIETLTGEMEKSYQLQIGKFTLPIWPWNRNQFNNEQIEQNKKQIEFRNWKFPVQYIENNHYEAEVNHKTLTKQEAIEIGVAQAKTDLVRELGGDAKILSGKVLHERIDRGKVNLSLYITVEEDIAIGQPINQGD